MRFFPAPLLCHANTLVQRTPPFRAATFVTVSGIFPVCNTLFNEQPYLDHNFNKTMKIFLGSGLDQKCINEMIINKNFAVLFLRVFAVPPPPVRLPIQRTADK